MHNNVTYPILRRMLGYTNDQQPHLSYHPMMFKCTYFDTSMFNIVMRCNPMLPIGLQVYKCTQMTLGISMLNNIFPLAY